jgi:hypothetical protein
MTVAAKCIDVTVKLRVAQVADERATEVCHYDWVSIQLREHVAIALDPSAQSKSIGFDLHRFRIAAFSGEVSWAVVFPCRLTRIRQRDSGSAEHGALGVASRPDAPRGQVIQQLQRGGLSWRGGT